LLVIGVIGLLWEFNVFHVHEHWHGLVQHRHFHTWLHGHLTTHGEHKTMFSIGIVHGLASNDELLYLLVVALGVATLGGILVGVAPEGSGGHGFESRPRHSGRIGDLTPSRIFGGMPRALSGAPHPRRSRVSLATPQHKNA